MLVIGAGPAGASAAAKLAQAGLSIAIVDKKKFPRTKPCGNLLSGYCLNLLDRELPPNIIRGEVTRAIIEYKYKVHLTFDQPIAKFVRRFDFDNQLLNWAIEDGAVFRNDKVEKICKDRDGLTAIFRSGNKIRSQFIVGADGANGVSSRYVRNKKYRRWEQGIAFYCEIPKSHFVSPWKDLHNTIYVNSANFGGYAWIFPQQQVLNVGLGTNLLLAKNLRQQLLVYVRERLAEDSEISAIAHPLPIGGIPRKLYKHGVLLVGDAAGTVDPISGEGIGFAVCSGKLAAKAIIKSSPQDVEKYYWRLFQQHIAREVRPMVLFALTLMVFRPIFFSMRPKTSTPIFRKQFAAVAGKISNRQFVKDVFKMLPGLLWHNIFISKAIDRK